MKVLFLTFGDETVASSRTRVYQFVPHLRAAGIKTAVIPYDYAGTFSNKITHLFADETPAGARVKRLLFFCSARANALIRLVQTARFLAGAFFADVIFIQKLPLPFLLQRIIRKINPVMVFDFDDAVFAQEDRLLTARFDALIAAAALVTVENDYTADYVRRFNPAVFQATGPIDCGRYRPAAKSGEGVVIGWIGSYSTTPYLEPVADVLKELCAEHPGVTLNFIGARKSDRFGGSCVFKKWTLATETQDLQAFDIGLMPLPDDEWTRGKGGYKVLQYMAAGIPSVASPVGINATLVRDGETGFLAGNAGEWREKLERLVTDKALRLSQGKAARKLAEDAYSFEFYTPLLIERLKLLVKNGGRRA